MHNNMHNNDAETMIYRPGNFLAGVLLGGLAGAGAMLLMAPQSGQRTRAQIQLKGMEMREQATEAVNDAVVQTSVQARNLLDAARGKAHELQQNSQEMLTEQKNQMKATVSAAKAAVHAAKE